MPQLVASPRKANPLWFTPICDEVARKIAIWDKAYWLGEIHSTRQWLNPKSGDVENKPTRMAHDMPWRDVELDHLIRVIGSLRPDTPLLKELEEVRSIWKYGKPVMGFRLMKSYWSQIQLPKGIHRVLTMAFYPEHVKEILAILEEAKTGQKSASLEAAVEQARQEGKELFEE